MVAPKFVELTDRVQIPNLTPIIGAELEVKMNLGFKEKI